MWDGIITTTLLLGKKGKRRLGQAINVSWVTVARIWVQECNGKDFGKVIAIAGYQVIGRRGEELTQLIQDWVDDYGA